ncbi:MAG: hypothetical protein AAB405_01800 [Patescibacteria group bacterium]
MNKKLQIVSGKKIIIIFIVYVIIMIITALIVISCAPGDRIIFRPDVYINYTPHPYYSYNQRYDYGTYYLYFPIVVQNTSTTNFVEIALNGKQILPQRIPPGKTENVNVRVEIGERRDVILTASCYTASEKLTGTAYRELYIYIGSYERPADIWPVYCPNP